jgi:glycosyltransferase involved in cell wall biosynthesis
MRIAMISTPFLAVPPQGYGGTELVVHELVEGLVEHGHAVTLFATGDSRTAAELRWLYPTAQWPPNPLPDINHVAWAVREAAHGRFDVVHVHSACALACTRFAAAPPMVYTLHHVRDEDLSRFYCFYPDVQYVAISADQAAREDALPHLRVIHHGLDASLYQWTPEPADYVCFVARFAEVKGPHTAIDAAEKAGVSIRVAGSVHPVDQEFGEREVLPRLKRPHVTYLGVIGMQQKVPLLRDARALLAPITWNEPFGLILIEAMLSGCPVVAYPHGSAPELIEPGVTGFLVEDEDELVRTIRAGGPLEGFDRRRCREHAVERFDRARMVRDYEALYGAVAARATGTPDAATAAGIAPTRAALTDIGDTSVEVSA